MVQFCACCENRTAAIALSSLSRLGRRVFRAPFTSSPRRPPPQNAGKIVNIIEGLGGLKYSVVDDSFTFADALPTNWTYMEWRVPVQKPGQDVTWVTARSERRTEEGRVVKTVTVADNPFGTLILAPWAEDAAVVTSSPAGAVSNSTPGHERWSFHRSNATVVLELA